MGEVVKRNWRQPLDKFKITCVFGLKDEYHPNGHRGTDYAGVPEGTPLKAVADGMTVVLNKGVKDSAVLGNVLVLQIGSRFFGYCHMKEQSALKVGDKVSEGSVVLSLEVAADAAVATSAAAPAPASAPAAKKAARKTAAPMAKTSAQTSPPSSPPNSSATKSPAAAPSSRPTSTTRNPSR